LPLAIILVCTASGTETHVLRNLKNSKGVLEVFPVNGAYDLVVKVKTETFDMLRECIAKIKQSLPKMQNMVTMLVVENSSPQEPETKKLKRRD
jgi:DNA-binding Lrp family transcriptional regulator